MALVGASKFIARWRSFRRLSSTSAQVKSINEQQHLYYVHPTSPGSPFFLPRGARIFSKLTAFARAQMRAHNFDEVITPQLYKKELWQISGHWNHYRDDMFGVVEGHTDSGEVGYSLKPMNCPGHCLIFGSQERSFRDLPIRYADFSSLHRNEASGALTGLTRVRRFHQDDGHIFCRPDQVASEIKSAMKLVDTVYKVFDLKYERVLSTRPEDFTGEISLWNNAETALRDLLGENAQIREGDGAFYGPKIDYIVTDNIGNRHQAATVQLDFQLPLKFNLSYDDISGTGTPVMIHRAVFGSVERFLALLADHYQGIWPFWLNPLQAAIVPVSDAHLNYAYRIADKLRGLNSDPAPLHEESYDVDVYSQSEPVSGRIRRAANLHASYIVVVGDREQQNETISVRKRGTKKSVNMTVDELKADMKTMNHSYQ